MSQWVLKWQHCRSLAHGKYQRFVPFFVFRRYEFSPRSKIDVTPIHRPIAVTQIRADLRRQQSSATAKKRR